MKSHSPCWCTLLLFLSLFLLSSCAFENGETKAVQQVIARYDELLTAGYRTLNMNPLQEVTTPELATKAYHHMAALGEGRLRMESAVKKLKFVAVRFPAPGEATVETSETWDFTHVDITSGKKYAEEKDFVYDMAYSLKKTGGRWLIDRVNTIKGTSTNSVIPWPKTDRQGVPQTLPGGGRQ